LAQVATPLAGAAHAFPHVLQLSALVVTSTHAPLHATSVPGQVDVQPFGPQTWVRPQAVVHAPQCFGSLVTSASHPSDALPLQSARPASHSAVAQAPFAHLAVPWGIAQGAQDGSPHPVRGSSRATHAPPHDLRPSGHASSPFPPSPFGGSVRGVASAGDWLASSNPASSLGKRSLVVDELHAAATTATRAPTTNLRIGP
jgi:hypothetical protein